ncbi:hypothetical protein T492DRAFT_836535 [Pavlovales sp. CCMP2436]|nr:hypothetical protein T492DRAFT_836535 [Pavlovales sp. CCMP2436]
MCVAPLFELLPHAHARAAPHAHHSAHTLAAAAAAAAAGAGEQRSRAEGRKGREEQHGPGERLGPEQSGPGGGCFNFVPDLPTLTLLRSHFAVYAAHCGALACTFELAMGEGHLLCASAECTRPQPLRSLSPSSLSAVFLGAGLGSSGVGTQMDPEKMATFEAALGLVLVLVEAGCPPAEGWAAAFESGAQAREVAMGAAHLSKPFGGNLINNLTFYFFFLLLLGFYIYICVVIAQQ